jgi:hypothetical protein
MGKRLTIAAAIWSAIWVPLAVMLTVSAQQGVSNLQSWATFVGLTWLSHAMEGPTGHLISKILVSANAALCALYYAILAYENHENVKKFFFPYGWPFKGN